MADLSIKRLFFGENSRFKIEWQTGQRVKLYDADYPGNKSVLIGEFDTKDQAYQLANSL